eukprot:Rmarinus@m.17128
MVSAEEALQSPNLKGVLLSPTPSPQLLTNSLPTLGRIPGQALAKGISSKRSKEPMKCSFCFDSVSNFIFEPCYHGGVCMDCSMNMKLRSETSCPVCSLQVKLVSVDFNPSEVQQTTKRLNRIFSRSGDAEMRLPFRLSMPKSISSDLTSSDGQDSGFPSRSASTSDRASTGFGARSLELQRQSSTEGSGGAPDDDGVGAAWAAQPEGSACASPVAVERRNSTPLSASDVKLDGGKDSLLAKAPSSSKNSKATPVSTYKRIGGRMYRLEAKGCWLHKSCATRWVEVNENLVNIDVYE